MSFKIAQIFHCLALNSLAELEVGMLNCSNKQSTLLKVPESHFKMLTYQYRRLKLRYGNVF